MEDEKEMRIDEHAGIEMLKVLLTNGMTPIDMINSMAYLNGMVSCGLAFSVKGEHKPRRKAFQIQQDLAKATRKAIENQSSEAFEHLSFQGMFETEH